MGIAEVPIGEFNNISKWVLEWFGPRAILTGAPFALGLMREAIQVHSQNIEEAVIYKRPGWVGSDDDPIFVHAAGAISKKGAVNHVAVDFGDSVLSRYRLANPPVNPEQQMVVRQALEILNVAPDRITVPLLSAVVRAPLCEIKPVDYFPFAVGTSGVQKTALVAVFQAFFGRGFNERNLPGSWSSTANAIEMLLSQTKDCFVVIDDFAPTGTRYDVDKLHAKAESVIRKIRNHDHRGRLRADLKFRPETRCNGFPQGSGEERPRGFSLQAGMLFEEFSPGDVDLKLLTIAQKRAAEGVYEKAMSAYLRHLADRMKGLRKDFPQRCERIRDGLRGKGGHDRTPDAVASLEAALSVFLDFACLTMSITLEERTAYAARARKAFEFLVESQATARQQQDPIIRFVQLLGAVFYSNQAHLDNGDGGMPDSNASILGWKKQDSSFGGAFKPSGQRIGWVKGRELWLHSDLAYSEVQKLAIRQGAPIPLDVGTLWRRLGQKGFILKSESEGKYSLKRQMPDGTRQRFRVMLLDTLLNGSKAPEVDPPPVNAQGPEQESDHVH